MKIGLVLASAPGYSETFIRSKIKGLQTSGHEVVLFCSDSLQSFNICPVILLPKRNKNFFKQAVLLFWIYLGLIPHFNAILRFITLERHDGVSWFKILKRIYNNGPILQQNVDWLHFGFGTLAIGRENLAAAKKAKMAVSFRGFDIGVYPIKHPKCYDRVWEKVFKIHVISDDISELLYKYGYQDQAIIVKITPAINTEYFSALGSLKVETPVQIITVARLHWKKGLEYTLEALALLKQRGIKFQYRIIGTGAEAEALKFATYQLELQDQVTFLGKLEPKQVKIELEKSQLYIQYSVQEGFCNSVLEAQAMGLLCLVSDAEGLAENVMHEKTGWVVQKRTPIKLMLQLINVINLSIFEKEKISRLAQNRVKNEFNIRIQEQEFNSFYK